MSIHRDNKIIGPQPYIYSSKLHHPNNLSFEGIGL